MSETQSRAGLTLYALRRIAQPALVVNGSHDVIMPPINSFIMEPNIPNAQLIIYPDA
jgi:pimeloyl-ACP methyl ester carboxylesterase